jgi:hypothetical protein
MRRQGELLPRGYGRRWRLELAQRTLRFSWLKTRFPTWGRSLNAGVEFTDLRDETACEIEGGSAANGASR